MSRSLACCIALIGLAVPLPAQTGTPDANTPMSTLQINSRAVLVDVIVTDSSGKPITGLPEDAFTVSEQGKPQGISFFEEHTAAPAAAPQEMPKYPPDVFSNFSPFPQPAAVNVLLLDSLNTRIEDQAVVHERAMKFLKSAKPGTRTAIFTMGLGLHFIQGFNDDPAVLAAALNNKKNNEMQSSEMLKGQEESNAQSNLVGMMGASAGNGGTAAPQAMITSLQTFMNENDTSQSTGEGLITLVNVQRLAAFLEGFPGRKNIIWFAEKVPSVFISGGDGTNNPAMADEIQKTLAMLASARAAIYPVYAPGVSVDSLYIAENNLSHAITQPSQLIGPQGAFVESLGSDEAKRSTEIGSAKILAEQSGGRAFATNGMSDVIEKVTADSSHFYTISYVPTNEKMDGRFRNIEVKIPGEKYDLSYRQGYFAIDAALPGSAMNTRNQEVQKLAAQNPGAVDPLLPFMDLGMPQSQQILYKVRVFPVAAADNEPADKKDKNHYKVDFAIDLKDLNLNLGTDGLHKGTLRISLIVYDRYGNVISREDRLAELNIKPNAYAIFQSTGVQLHDELAVPKGNYWLRTGVYDEGSRKVGTMEIPLSSVVPLQVSTVTKRTMESENAKILVPVLPAAAAVLSVRAAEEITAEQLEHTLGDAHGRRDRDLAKQIGGMELSERLSSPRLAKIQTGMPGEKSRLALLALADASAFLQLPVAEIPATAPPDADTQRLILSRATEYLVASIHKLPDFFARQTTTRFHDLKVSYPTNEPTILEHQAFQPLDSFSDTIYYRNGLEVEETNEKPQKVKSRPRNGLEDWGVFGPLLRVAVTDIYKGKMAWGHWEQRATGPVAVFQYAIPKEKSNYVVKYCCLGLPNTGLRSFESIPPFHGEIAIDPVTGAVYRLVLITDLSPSDPIFQDEIMVEYGPLELGGKTYICPSKSVTITTATSLILHQDCANTGGGVSCTSNPTETFRPKDTAVNDTVYDSYHVFGTEMRIMPAEGTGKEDKSSPDSPAPAPTVNPGAGSHAGGLAEVRIVGKYLRSIASTFQPTNPVKRPLGDCTPVGARST